MEWKAQNITWDLAMPFYDKELPGYSLREKKSLILFFLVSTTELCATPSNNAKLAVIGQKK